MTEPGSGPVSIAEIADLLAWARRLTEDRPANPAERAAYPAAKAALPARITDQNAAGPCHREAARDIAAQARSVADQATRSHPAPRTPNDR
jgi:hypothetical protein